MALIVCTSRPVKDRPVKSEVDTFIFEDEEMGRQYVEEHGTFVFSVQKARIIYAADNTEVRS